MINDPIIYIFALCLSVLFITWLYFKYDKKLREYKKENVALIKKYHKELHFRKSAEVRLGKIGENLAPFCADWPWDPSNFRFLGNPVDGVQFNDDEVIFVEIKTGGARLNKSQKNFKNLIEAGKVSFVTYKVTENGTKLVKEGEVEEI